jgi:aminomethyltransferase
MACDLAARNSLRFESCMPLYGHKLSASTSALVARMGWTACWYKEFIGRSAMLKVKLEGPQRRLVGFEMVDKAGCANTVPRP